MLYALINIVGYLSYILLMLVIIQFVLSLLISFNVVNMHNNFVAAVWQALNAILDPILNPIRRLMPDTGAIDFSPMVLIILLRIIGMLLEGVAVSTL